MSDTVTGVNDETRQITRVQLVKAALAATNLTVERQSGLHTDIQTLNAKRLEHDLCHLFTVLGSVKRRLRKNKPVVFGLASQILINRFVPEALDTFPVLDLTSAQHIAQVVRLCIGKSIITDIVVKFSKLKLGVFL